MNDWIEQSSHRRWLTGQADQILAVFEETIIDKNGGYFSLDTACAPLTQQPTRFLFEHCRLIFCFSIAARMGRPGAMPIVEHGLRALDTQFRDPDHGGFFAKINKDGTVIDTNKYAYEHAFVLLAAAAAFRAGSKNAKRLLTEITQLVETHFWDEKAGAAREEFSQDWQTCTDYRGANANMHLTEALMVAYEVTGNQRYLSMANDIANLIINQKARAAHWGIPEHFDANWQIDDAFEGDPAFKPQGLTPGHSFEWARLIVQLYHLRGRQDQWMPEAAEKLFTHIVDAAWNTEKGGFSYTLDENLTPVITHRMWWPLQECIAAAHALRPYVAHEVTEHWYRRCWDFASVHFMDKKNGGWFPSLDANNNPTEELFAGKPDIYHTLQAYIIPLLPSGESAMSDNLLDLA